jgi:hypothetical protein
MTNILKMEVHIMSIKTVERDGVRVEVDQDDTDGSCSRDFYSLGHMICWHNRYALGDKHDYKNFEDFVYQLAQELDIDVYTKDGFDRETEDLWEEVKKQIIVLPLYLYDHSGLSMSYGSFNDPWDSGQVGYIYVTYNEIKKEYKVDKVTPEIVQEVLSVLEDEVEMYDLELKGDVYYYKITKYHKCPCCGQEVEEDYDCCGGFYGWEALVDGVKDAVPEGYEDLADKLNE